MRSLSCFALSLTMFTFALFNTPLGSLRAARRRGHSDAQPSSRPERAHGKHGKRKRESERKCRVSVFVSMCFFFDDKEKKSKTSFFSLQQQQKTYFFLQNEKTRSSFSSTNTLNGTPTLPSPRSSSEATILPEIKREATKTAAAREEEEGPRGRPSSAPEGTLRPQRRPSRVAAPTSRSRSSAPSTASIF